MAFRSRYSPFVALGAVVLAALAVSACTPMQTFPPTSGRPVFDTNVPPLPQLCAIGISTGHKQSSFAEEPIVYNLPPGMNRAAWRHVASNLPASAQPSRPGETHVVSVEEVRVDGGTAQVDVLVPKGEIFQLVTIHLTGSPLGPWKVTYVQPWTLRNETSPCNNPWAEATDSATTGDAAPKQ